MCYWSHLLNTVFLIFCDEPLVKGRKSYKFYILIWVESLINYVFNGLLKTRNNPRTVQWYIDDKKSTEVWFRRKSAEGSKHDPFSAEGCLPLFGSIKRNFDYRSGKFSSQTSFCFNNKEASYCYFYSLRKLTGQIQILIKNWKAKVLSCIVLIFKTFLRR